MTTLFRLKVVQQLITNFRCLSVLAHKVSQTPAFDDRRVKRELQECYSKLLDAVVASYGRSSEQGTWIRRSNRDTALLNGRETPLSRGMIVLLYTDSWLKGL